MAEPRPGDGPGIERTITLVDAVVAIAMTLLILPLVDLVSELDLDDFAGFWAESSSQLTTFVISFVVIFAFWGAHGTLYSRLRKNGQENVRWLGLLNLGWLLVIAFLPFPTALIGRDITTTTAPIYLGTLFVLSALTLGMTVVVNRSVGLPVGPAWLTTAVFGLCLVISPFAPSVAMYLLLALIVVRHIEARAYERATARTAAGRSAGRAQPK
jgi:uncharacterized membrane protein